MITKDNPSMNSTAESIYMSKADFIISEKCRAREDAIAHERYVERKMSELTSDKIKLASENKELTSEIHKLKALLDSNGISYDK